MSVPPNDELMQTVATITAASTTGHHRAAAGAGLPPARCAVGYEAVRGEASKRWLLLGTAVLMAVSVRGDWS